MTDLSDGARRLLLTAFQVRLSLLDGPDGMLLVTHYISCSRYRRDEALAVQRALAELVDRELVVMTEYAEYVLTARGKRLIADWT